MQKENITIESSKDEFILLTEKTMSLKNSIEKEINEINTLYDKTHEEITKSFERRHEILIKKENELKEELQNKVTQIKEKLENFLSESNRILKVREKITKGIKALEKEKEKNMIKILSYVAKINHNKNETIDFLGKFMKNLNLSFQEEETNIKYKEYYFNGLQIPKNIQISDIGINSAKIVWNIEDIYNTNLDLNKLKSRIEIRNEKKSEKFEIIYEGNNKEYLVEKLSNGQDYEFRICLVYEDLIGPWSDIKKFQTSKFESIILSETQNEDQFLDKIVEWCGFKNLELLYRGTKDGPTSNIFHDKCDNQGPTLCLYKNENGNIFGGYTSISWNKDGGTCTDSKSFIFTLTNIFEIEPTKFSSKSSKNVHHALDYGPSFGEHDSDISIYSNFLEKESKSNFPEQYEDSIGKGKPIFTGNSESSKNLFKIKEVEVFKIF